MKSQRTKKKVTVELDFNGDGTIAKIGPMAFYGGVPSPQINRSLQFTVRKEFRGRDGLWNPRTGSSTVVGGFQVVVFGTSRGYRKLGRYFLALAEIDSSQDVDYHEHVDGVVSSDGRTRFDFNLRKKR